MQLVLPQLRQPLQLWERIEIAVGEQMDTGRYVARIEDFVEEGIVISTPEFVDGSTLLRENSNVTVFIAREDALYQFHSRIRQIRNEAKISHLLTPPKDVLRIQRRRFVRIDLFAEVWYANLSEDKITTHDHSQFTWRTLQVVDMSGAGMLLKGKEVLQPNALLLLKIPFLKKIELPEIIVAVCRRTFDGKEDLLVGVEFITSEQFGQHFTQKELMTLPRSVKQFDHNAQNKLSAYVFQQQIERRRKGML